TQITSLNRSKADNDRVGGVANSQHMRGTAGDFVVPAAQRGAFMAQARQMGYEAIDEGDHVHLELPRGAQTAQAGGQLRSAPKAPAVPSGYRANADGSLTPIPGGPAQIAIDARADAAAARKAAEDLKASQKRQEADARQAASAEASNQIIAAID